MEKESSNKLVEEINTLSSDDEYVELYTKLSRKEMEYNTYIYEAKEEGYKLGHQLGYESGHQSGVEETAKKMLENNIDLEIITKATNLTKEQILNLQ